GILLTGAGGQLGQALQTILADQAVAALDHRHLDILQLNAVREAVQAYHPDVVLNVAAYNNVDGAESDPNAAYRGNALGPRNLAVVTAAHHVPLLHLSTDYVFDGASKRPYDEYDLPHPRSIYRAIEFARE